MILSAELAKKFHDIYEKRRMEFGHPTYRPKKEFDPKSPEGALLLAVCDELQESSGVDIVSLESDQKIIHKDSIVELTLVFNRFAKINLSESVHKSIDQTKGAGICKSMCEWATGHFDAILDQAKKENKSTIHLINPLKPFKVVKKPTEH